AEVDEDPPDGSVAGDGDTGEAVFEAATRFSGALLGGGVAAAGNADKVDIGMFSNAQMFGAGELTVNADGEVVDATFDNGLYGGGVNNIASAGMVTLDSGEIMEPGFDADLGVGWGRWTGPMTVDGVSGKRGNLAFTVTDNFTAPTRLKALGGTINYALAGGPKAFTPNSGTTWKVDAIQFGVDFNSTSVLLDTFQLTKSNNDKASVIFTQVKAGSDFVDVDNNALGFDMDNGTDFGTLAGSFVGTNGEGMVVVYHVDATDEDSSRTTVTGTSVLKQTP
ncbi:MAG: hypothetical protein R3225_10920, partial [Halofilum sp. (in: g-proteobacteria)]|nr:hypothetical protein [Halofilum sp. (in: g-proteobacteria)]